MAGPRWDDEMKFELFRLRSDLRTENFRVLAPPLGLGRLSGSSSPQNKGLYPSLTAPLPLQAIGSQRPLQGSGSPRQPALQPQQTHVPQRQPSMPLQTISSQRQPAQTQRALLKTEAGPRPAGVYPDESFYRQSDHAQGAPPTAWKRWLHRAAIHILDLSFVALCLALGIIMLGFILDPATFSLVPAQLVQTLPVQAMSRLQPWAIVIGVYLIFGLYWLFFKIVAGSTLGESCLQNQSENDETMAAAHGKASGES